MKGSILKLIFLSAFSAVVFLFAFYFSAFMAGYGSNKNYIGKEKAMMLMFAISNIVVAEILLYKYGKFSYKTLVISMFIILAIYIFAAWHFGYFIM